MNLENLSAGELKELQKAWYKEANENGRIAKLYLIGRELGEPVTTKYGPKYKYSKNGLAVFVDDYGGYMTATFNEKVICSTHYCHQTFVPDNWDSSIDELASEARVKKAGKEANKEATKIDEMLTRLRG